MRIPKGETTTTGDKLIATACEIFAEKGFRDTTIAEISQRAGTNIAAVNYHFGSKEGLYREVWHHVFAASIQAHPPGGGIPESAAPDERLLGQVTALLLRLADRDNQFFNFLYWEFTNPTGLLEEVIKEHLLPLQQGTKRLVQELLGPCANEQEIRFCELALIGQCMNPMVVRGELGKQGAGQKGLKRRKDIEAYARHVVAFSLAGIEAIRRAAEARQDSGRRRGSKMASSRK